MFNSKRFSAICFVFIFVSGCSGSLPSRQASEPDTGVLAIPVSMDSNGVAHPPVWLMDFEVHDTDGNAVGEPVRLLPYEGRRFIFVAELQAGTYEIKRVRTASRFSGAVNSGVNPFEELTTGIPFLIETGAVTVLPVILHYEREYTGPETISTNYEFKELSAEAKEFRTVLDKSRNIDGWHVSWPE